MTTSAISHRASAAPNRPVVAELEGVTFGYGDERVLDDITLRIQQGNFLGIIGPNGAGKTTLIRVLLGLVRPHSGRVGLFGIDIRAFSEWHRVGYVPQKGSLEARVPATVLEVVLSGRVGRGGVGRYFGRSDRETAVDALRTVGMGEAQHRLIGRLSAGQQQRVLIARALANHPDLLVLDEPTVGVDPDAQEQFYSLLQRLNRDFGTTLVLVSHDIGVVAQEVTQLACLNRALVFHGSPEEAMRSGALAQLYREQSWMVAHHH